MTKGFNRYSFETLYQHEENSFWFQGRNQLIISFMTKHLNQPEIYYEIGCGTGFVTRAVHRTFPKCQIIGSELFEEALQYARIRVPDAKFIKADATTLHHENVADVVGIFDVLEHIENDSHVLRTIHALLKTDGLLFLTVPQHQWLWSDQDDIACHVRRYNAKDLHEKLHKSGFKILKSTSFITTLLPIMAISRMLKNKNINKDYKRNPTSEFKIPSLMNRLLYYLFRIDLALIHLGVNLPIGGSRLVVAKKLSSQ